MLTHGEEIMNYYVEDEVTKVGYRPIGEEEFERIFCNGSIISDTYKSGRRHRIIVLENKWFCWESTGEYHACWEFDEDIRLNLDSFKKMKKFFIEIENYMEGDNV